MALHISLVADAKTVVKDLENLRWFHSRVFRKKQDNVILHSQQNRNRMNPGLQFGRTVGRSFPFPLNWGWQVMVHLLKAADQDNALWGFGLLPVCASRCLIALAHASSSCGVKPGPGTAAETLSTKRWTASSLLLHAATDIAHVHSSHYDVSICSAVTLTRQDAKKHLLILSI